MTTFKVELRPESFTAFQVSFYTREAIRDAAYLTSGTFIDEYNKVPRLEFFVTTENGEELRTAYQNDFIVKENDGLVVYSPEDFNLKYRNVTDVKTPMTSAIKVPHISTSPLPVTSIGGISTAGLSGLINTGHYPYGGEIQKR